MGFAAGFIVVPMIVMKGPVPMEPVETRLGPITFAGVLPGIIGGVIVGLIYWLIVRSIKWLIFRD